MIGARLVFALLATALGSASAWAIDLPVGRPTDFMPAAGIRPHANPADYEGIVALSNCSAAVVRLEGQPTSQPALVLSNGHCVGGFIPAGTAIANVARPRSAQVFDAGMIRQSLPLARIVYATMTDTDVAIYESTLTYDQLGAQYGIHPFMLAAARPVDGTRITILSGYWARSYDCQVQGFAYRLREDAWTWKDSVRYSMGCDLIGGTSGSPLVEVGTRNVIGIHNTGNEAGARCTLDNPCEVTDSGVVTVDPGRRYGQQTYPLVGCFDAVFAFNAELPTCALPRPEPLTRPSSALQPRT